MARSHVELRFLVVHLVDVRVEQLGNVILSLVEGDLRIAFQHGLRPTATAERKGNVLDGAIRYGAHLGGTIEEPR